MTMGSRGSRLRIPIFISSMPEFLAFKWSRSAINSAGPVASTPMLNVTIVAMPSEGHSFLNQWEPKRDMNDEESKGTLDIRRSILDSEMEM